VDTHGILVYGKKSVEESNGVRKNRFLRRLPVFILTAVLLFCFSVSAFATEGKSAEKVETARPSVNGALHVEGTELKDRDGNTVVLRGISTHGLTWYPDFVSEEKFRYLSSDWNCNLIRLAAYSQEYVNGNKEETLSLVKKGVDAAIAADMYVLVDWHVLEEQDPNVNKRYAEEFFDTITAAYPDCPNIIYEICNEPNGDTTWLEVKKYAEEVIPVVREKSPSSVIVVGTPAYDRMLTPSMMSPVNGDNLMYSLHFYAASHKEELRSELKTAVEGGLPVFISECGLSEDTGDGKTDYASAAEWFSYLREHNISFAVWSFSNKNESSAMLKPDYKPASSIRENDLTAYGQWVRSLVRGEDPLSIPEPAAVTKANGLLRFFVIHSDREVLNAVGDWPRNALFVGIGLILFFILRILYSLFGKKSQASYDDIGGKNRNVTDKEKTRAVIRMAALILSMFFTILYLVWRIRFSVPFKMGVLPVVANVLLLFVEILGFIESLVLYRNLMGMKEYPVPVIKDEEFPDVDVFIATYNEPAELLRKTINGCNHLLYPDKSKVHIWLCDDNRRPEIRKLAEEMGVGYFDRPDNKGAKAGNLNNAMAHTSSPYIVTFDADMIPMSHFLLNTIPYFVDSKKQRGEEKGLGLLQTPQCFYEPDIFQHALYSEKNAPNEQDFFYRTVEVAKTTSNSVIYGGSNTVLSREALDAVGGFYTESITEDFATGMLIEAAGYISLALPEPMASGTTPNTYKEHIQQRRRWGRGVIGTAKKLKLLGQKGLSFEQKLSYLSSVIYWYSPLKCALYLITPLLFAVFTVPVFKCGWLDLLVYWLPMYIFQDLTLRVFSGNAISLKWSGIYEMSVMPHLLIPLFRETFGISASVFEVTDKSGRRVKNRGDANFNIPFYVLIGLSVIGIIRSIVILAVTKAFGIVVLLFWLTRNIYFLIMALFLVDGRDGESGNVKVVDAEPVTIQGLDEAGDAPVSYGVTTLMTENIVKLFIDEPEGLKLGNRVKICIEKDPYRVEILGILNDELIPRSGGSPVYTAVITDFLDSKYEYLQVLYDRVPTLPQTLNRDLGIITHMLINAAHRILDSNRSN